MDTWWRYFCKLDEMMIGKETSDTGNLILVLAIFSQIFKMIYLSNALVRNKMEFCDVWQNPMMDYPLNEWVWFANSISAANRKSLWWCSIKNALYILTSHNIYSCLCKNTQEIVKTMEKPTTTLHHIIWICSLS